MIEGGMSGWEVAVEVGKFGVRVGREVRGSVL
jgi:hypothetical protein